MARFIPMDEEGYNYLHNGTWLYLPNVFDLRRYTSNIFSWNNRIIFLWGANVKCFERQLLSTS